MHGWLQECVVSRIHEIPAPMLRWIALVTRIKETRRKERVFIRQLWLYHALLINQTHFYVYIVMPKLVNNSNGLLIERFLVQYVFHQPKVLLYMNYRSQQKPERNQPIFSRNEKLYERIHAKHNNSDNQGEGTTCYTP